VGEGRREGTHHFNIVHPAVILMRQDNEIFVILLQGFVRVLHIVVGGERPEL
jgi:hypothetical protein